MTVGQIRAAIQRTNEEGEDGEDGEPLTYAQLISELRHAGHTLADIAGYDDVQISHVICLKRDKYGQLVRRKRNDLPDWVEVDENGMRIISKPVPFSKMYRQVQRDRGLSKEAASGRWKAYQAANPKLGTGS